MEETNSNSTIKEDTNEETTQNIENILVQPNNSTQSEGKQPILPKQQNSNPRRKQNNAMNTEKLNRLFPDSSQQHDKSNKRQTTRQPLPHLSPNEDKGTQNSNKANLNEADTKNEPRIPQNYLKRTAFLEKKNKMYQQTIHNNYLKKQPLDTYRESIADKWLTSMKCAQRSTKRRKYPANYKLPPMEENKESKLEQQASDISNALQSYDDSNENTENKEIEKESSDVN